MCGIAGMLWHPEAPQLTRRMLDLMAHRGPDGQGFVDFEDGSLGMSRLRIRGENSYPLPIWNARTNTWVSYNGEVYGRVGMDGLPPGGGPAEVDSIFLAASERTQVDGMFAFASVAGGAGSALTIRLSRDPFGIKPLYYRKISGGCAFASEVAPLARIEPERLNNQDGAVAEFMAFGRVLADRTFYRQIRSVPPGATLELSESDKLTGTGTQPADVPACASDLRTALRTSVERCLVSDRPLGLALSGGLDSSIIAYELNALGVENIVTISIRMPGVADGLDELRHLGLPPGGAWTTWRHHVATFEPTDLLPMMDVAVKAGQPTRMTSFPLYLLLAQAAKSADVVVILTGEGADELFLGYTSYLSWNKPSHLSTFERLYEFALPAKRRAWLASLLGHESVEWCRARFQESYQDIAELEPFQALRCLERALSLEPLLLRTDYCLMLHGIEGRTPFLHGDVPALSTALGPRELLGDNETKLALRAAYRDELPPPLRSTTKCAFRAPVANWFAGSLAPWVSARLRDYQGELEALKFNQSGIKDLLNTTLKGDEEAATLCFALLALLSWKSSGQARG